MAPEQNSEKRFSTSAARGAPSFAPALPAARNASTTESSHRRASPGGEHATASAASIIVAPIAGALAAEDLLGRVAADTYPQLPAWDGYAEAVGAMVDAKGNPMPASFHMVGRQVSVTAAGEALATLGVKVSGLEVRVVSHDANGRVLAEMIRFIPEPGGAP